MTFAEINTESAPTRRLTVSAVPAAVLHFRKIVWNNYKKSGRHNLPWRKSHDPYRVLVSEIMLQQTQVERVVPFYRKFIKKFPTVKKLAAAPLSDILKSWQGLGYNRRAKMLQQAAHVVVSKYDGEFPKETETLQSLPGVGPYTARAVAAFSFNEPVILVETNIRTAVIHHFFPGKKKISDEEVEDILEDALPKGKSREWYSALMDYGASLKRAGISHNARSRKYTKQSKFTGSLREARGAVLRELALGAASPIRLSNLLGPSRRVQMRVALRALWKEKLVVKNRENYSLPD